MTTVPDFEREALILENERLARENEAMKAALEGSMNHEANERAWAIEREELEHHNALLVENQTMLADRVQSQAREINELMTDAATLKREKAHYQAQLNNVPRWVRAFFGSL